MTIASEITRLQWAKADIKTAIENKWVTVWNISLDNYAACIDAISSWWSSVEVLVVWWGWAWTQNFWWWGWGWVVKTLFSISWWSATVTVGVWWTTKGASWWYSQVLSWDNKVCATWWWGWAYVNGGTSWSIYINSTCVWWGNAWWTWAGASDDYAGWWGWGWAWWAWCAWTSWNWSDWWVWLYWYWWWWWGWSDRCWGTGVGAGVDWWGTWENRCLKRFCCNANNYWWWWGWWNRWTACWCQWVVDICYSIYWMSWFTSATWWNCCYTCDGMCVHRFTSNWTFTIVS